MQLVKGQQSCTKAQRNTAPQRVLSRFLLPNLLAHFHPNLVSAPFQYISVRDLAQSTRTFEALKILGRFPSVQDSSERASQAPATESEDPYASAQIVAVSRVRQGSQTFLVDKASGKVYHDDLDHPKVIGTWSPSTGVTLMDDTAKR